MTPTLLVLAAGMGSRYGGLKQLDPFGPNGETIIDYSVYDAARAGFGKVVFVIRRDFADEFREKVSDKYKNRIEVRTVFQGLENIPEGYTLHRNAKNRSAQDTLYGALQKRSANRSRLSMPMIFTAPRLSE